MLTLGGLDYEPIVWSEFPLNFAGVPAMNVTVSLPSFGLKYSRDFLSLCLHFPPVNSRYKLTLFSKV